LFGKAPWQSIQAFDFVGASKRYDNKPIVLKFATLPELLADIRRKCALTVQAAQRRGEDSPMDAVLYAPPQRTD
jgi:hypothetical protein